jgi:hypothetical protein
LYSTFYKILNLDPSLESSANRSSDTGGIGNEEIKKQVDNSYRALARIWHPDNIKILWRRKKQNKCLSG